MKKILVTTTDSLTGWEIENYLMPVFANVVVGAGFLSDFNASITDFFGGRSNSYEKKLQVVNDSALNILKSKAVELGANCILGLKVDMDQISGKNVQMFMVTAYGTAVVAKNISAPKAAISSKESSKEADKSTINGKAILIKLLDDIKASDYKLTIESLQTIVDSKSPDFKEFVIKKYKNHVLSSTLGVNEQADKLYKEYFSNIDPEFAISILYDEILREPDTEFLNKIIEIIKLFDLVDYDYCIKLLQADAFSTRKTALTILINDKPFYIVNDIYSITEITSLINTAFPLRASISAKKGFLSSNEKEIWTCECGKSHSINEKYCGNCFNDKYGFREDSIKPKQTIEVLNNKILALKEFFNLQT